MKSKSAIKPDSGTAFRVAAHVIANPGREMHEIAAAMGWTVRHCSKALTGAKQGGLIDVSRAGNKPRWYSVAGAAAATEEGRQKVRERELVRLKLRSEQKSMRRIDERASGPGLSDFPVHRHASATAPLPFRCTAVRSVFHLGAAWA